MMRLTTIVAFRFLVSMASHGAAVCRAMLEATARFLEERGQVAESAAGSGRGRLCADLAPQEVRSLL